MAQLITITSEALQATIRRLLPSQRGFGEDLQASNVIQPIIDLTPTAEGSQLPYELQTAVNFDDATTFNDTNSSTTVANTPGFYRIQGTAVNRHAGAVSYARFAVNNGLSDKVLWQLFNTTDTNAEPYAVSFDFVFFLDTGHTASVATNSASSNIAGSCRNIADRYGNLANPGGFTFE